MTPLAKNIMVATFLTFLTVVASYLHYLWKNRIPKSKRPKLATEHEFPKQHHNSFANDMEEIAEFEKSVENDNIWKTWNK